MIINNCWSPYLLHEHYITNSSSYSESDLPRAWCSGTWIYSLVGGWGLICSLPWFWRFGFEGPRLRSCDDCMCSPQTAACLWRTSVTLTKENLHQMCGTTNITTMTHFCSHNSKALVCIMVFFVSQRSGLHHHDELNATQAISVMHLFLVSNFTTEEPKVSVFTILSIIIFWTSGPLMFECKHCFRSRCVYILFDSWTQGKIFI